MARNKNSISLKFILKAFISAILLIIVIFIGYKLFNGKIVEKTKPLITREQVEGVLKQSSDLVSLKYKYKNAARLEDKGIKILNLNMPFTSKNFIITYKGEIGAGINVEDIKINIINENVDNKEKKNIIVLTIPDAKIIYHQTFEDSLEVLNEQDGLFNKITIEDFNNFQKINKKDIENELIEDNFLKEAKQHSIKVIKTLIAPLCKECEIVIKDK